MTGTLERSVAPVIRRTRSVPNVVTPLVLAAVFLLSGAVVLLPVFGTSFQSLPGDGGDMRLVNYVLEHSHQFFAGQIAQFWNAPFLYPQPNVLVLSENQVGAAPFYSIYRSIGLDRESSLQAWIVTGFALNYLSAAVVLLRLGFPTHLAALGAFLFAFSVPQMLHLGHTQLTYRFPIPLAWYAAYRYLVAGKSRRLALCVLFTCWQFYITPYYGYFLSLTLLATVLVYGASRADELTRRVRQGRLRTCFVHAGIAAAGVLLLVPVLVPYMSASIPSNPIEEVLTLLPRPQSYLMGSRGDYLAKLLASQWTVDVPYYWEHFLFPGLAALVAVPTVWVLLLFRRARHRMSTAVIVGAVTLLVLVLATLSVRDTSLYRIVVDLVPAVRSFRAVTRISLVLAFFAALCVCWLMSLCFSRFRALRPLPVQLGLVAMVWVVSAWEAGVTLTSTSKVEARRQIDRLVADVRPGVSRDSVLVALHTEADIPWYAAQVNGMLAAQELGVTTMNGYSRVLPPGFDVQPAQCTDVVAMARTYEKYVPQFRFAALVDRLAISPSALDCMPAWNRALHPVHAAGSNLADYSVAYDIRCLNCPAQLNETMQFAVNVKNASAHPWPPLPLALSARLVRASDGQPLSGFDIRVPIEQVIEAGGTVPLLLMLKGPADAGDYVVEFDMVHEHVAWFSQAGPDKGRTTVRVLAPPPSTPQLITPLRIW